MRILLSSLLVAVVLLAALSFRIGSQAAEPGAVLEVELDPIQARLAPDRSPSRLEVERVRAHLEEVESTLRRVDSSHLTPERREARARALDWLAEYHAAGIFPHNHTHSGERVPVFVDSHGTPCAVGFLLLRSGEEALVERVVAADNNVRVHDLAQDAQLGRWLDAHGLTLEEAAWIQPQYGGCSILGCPEPEPVRPSQIPNYNPKSAGLAGVTAGIMAWGLMADRPAQGVDWPGWLTLGIGVVDGAYAVRGAERSQDGWAIALNGFGGLAGSALGLRRLLARDSAPDGLERRALEVTPWVTAEHQGVAFRFRH